MALRAFHDNPGIGGFGESTPCLLRDTGTIQTSKREGSSHIDTDQSHLVKKSALESSNGNDLLCQIIKELVDNAVDACRSGTLTSSDHEFPSSPSPSRAKSNSKPLKSTRTEQKLQNKRIRVDIHPPKGLPNSSLLQITVTDNGCGMENIQHCVNPFHSTKDNEDSPNISESIGTTNSTHTSGRYGIGLTLCILHSQRCVPNSLAFVSSATVASKFRTRALFKVHHQQDSVECVEEEIIPGTVSNGTCISLLVPGGVAAQLAWPRLRDYFSRFRLCPKLHFDLDVFAPTLSQLPIFVRSSLTVDQLRREAKQQSTGKKDIVEQHLIDDNDSWEEVLDDDTDDCDLEGGDDDKAKKYQPCNHSKQNEQLRVKNDPQRFSFFLAVNAFWPKRKITYDNVARSCRDIRLPSSETRKGPTGPLEMEVGVAVCSPSYDQDDDSYQTRPHKGFGTNSNNEKVGEKSDRISFENEQTATLHLIRIVNDVPILDSTEVHSCGLVRGIANKTIWGSFGLDATDGTKRVSTSNETSSSSHSPMVFLRDSNLIKPFIHRSMNHKQLNYSTINNKGVYNKRKSHEISQQTDVLPANLRIGTILVVVHVRASPKHLPLPTLSKGRLPLHHKPIDSTLQLGLRDCLSNLRLTNPNLFLTSTKLRALERDVRYIPSMASAVSRIVCRSSNEMLREKSLAIFHVTAKRDNVQCNSESQVRKSKNHNRHRQQTHRDHRLNVSDVAKALESQLRLAIEKTNEKKNRKKQKKNADTVRNLVVGDSEENYDEFDSGGETENCVLSSRGPGRRSEPILTASRSHVKGNRHSNTKLTTKEIDLGHNFCWQKSVDAEDHFDEWW